MNSVKSFVAWLRGPSKGAAFVRHAATFIVGFYAVALLPLVQAVGEGKPLPNYGDVKVAVIAATGALVAAVARLVVPVISDYIARSGDPA